MATSPAFVATQTSAPSISKSTRVTLPDALSAANLDTIPVLTLILSRVVPPQSNNAPGSTPLPSQTGNTPAASFTSAPSASQLRPDATGQLNIKEVPAATDGLKYRLQRAKIEVQRLPGIEMGIMEQQEETKMWEEKISKQKEELRKLRSLGERMVGELTAMGKAQKDVVMGDWDEK